eukprot:2571941-Rhodomonas_salina.2
MPGKVKLYTGTMDCYASRVLLSPAKARNKQTVPSFSAHAVHQSSSFTTTQMAVISEIQNDPRTCSKQDQFEYLSAESDDESENQSPSACFVMAPPKAMQLENAAPSLFFESKCYRHLQKDEKTRSDSSLEDLVAATTPESFDEEELEDGGNFVLRCPSLIPRPGDKIVTAPNRVSTRSFYNRKIGAHLHTTLMERINKQNDEDCSLGMQAPTETRQISEEPYVPPPKVYTRRNRMNLLFLTSEEEQVQRARRSHRARHNRLVGAWLHEGAVASYLDIVQHKSLSMEVQCTESHCLESDYLDSHEVVAPYEDAAVLACT